ncbi:hypothetical protein B0J17DRAFT_20855 [Rhizoctonia solani]|nr:hypothetical protein B0J17DRAFT_20855 [Rhizoctonia solani]
MPTLVVSGMTGMTASAGIGVTETAAVAVSGIGIVNGIETVIATGETTGVEAMMIGAAAALALVANLALVITVVLVLLACGAAVVIALVLATANVIGFHARLGARSTQTQKRRQSLARTARRRTEFTWEISATTSSTAT